MKHPDENALADALALETLACRAGTEMTGEMEHSDALFLTSSFCFESAAQAADRFSGAESGNVYSRFTNPTVRAFEQRLAALEGGEACVATASGMAAILLICLGLLKTGDHVVVSDSVFGTTVALFSNILPKFGIEVTWVGLTDLDAWRDATRSGTRFMFLETPSNPMAEIADIEALSAISKASGALLIVDNCFCTPALQRPIDHGADVIIHSATKFLDGQGRCVGGAVVAPAALVTDSLFPILRSAGPTMSPFNAWVFLKGLETLALRMERHSASAMTIASWLEADPRVARVHYPGLPSHPQHQLARTQQKAFGGVLSFELAGGRTAAWSLIDNLRLFSITANLGDSRSIVTHPATTTHGRVPATTRERMGITEGLVRLSIGLEAPVDLLADLDRSLGPAALRS